MMRRESSFLIRLYFAKTKTVQNVNLYYVDIFSQIIFFELRVGKATFSKVRLLRWWNWFVYSMNTDAPHVFKLLGIRRERFESSCIFGAISSTSFRVRLMTIIVHFVSRIAVLWIGRRGEDNFDQLHQSMI